jgi:hypothetical protein
MTFFIHPDDVSIANDDSEGYRCPQLAVSVKDMCITDPFRTDDGMRSEVDDPEAEYGIPDDFARAMGIINMWLRTWSEAAETKAMADHRYVAMWSSNGFGDIQPELVGIEFFTTERGYSRAEISDIKLMDVGAIWQSRDYGNSHRVYRSK